jgi:hypothetical protein
MAEAFTHEEAQGLLFTFAGAWPALGRDAEDPSTRFVYMTIGELVCRFRGIELAPGAIVSVRLVRSRGLAHESR